MGEADEILQRARVAKRETDANRMEAIRQNEEERRRWVEVSGPILLRRRMQEKLGIYVPDEVPVRVADRADRTGTLRMFNNCSPSLCLTLDGMAWGINDYPADQLFLLVRAHDGKLQWEYVNALDKVAEPERRYGAEALIVGQRERQEGSPNV